MSQNKTKPQAKPTASKQSDEKLLRHVVIFKFKDSATPAQVKEVERAFSALPSKIPTIIGYEWGTNVSPENLAQGYTHCFLVTFKNAADRDAYLPHPAHKEFGKILGPHLDKVLVIDFFGAKN
ncbi:stress responsive protein [Adhaeribacter aerolatus]|uniref:Stress responsive protein n=2 Tax=Adhaeribacter aerolatus TaxID=670289 RepID=A0A512AWI0_9BACT|nr:stress responsive protein [Adhaeribacter aerolatus]